MSTKNKNQLVKYAIGITMVLAIAILLLTKAMPTWQINFYGIYISAFIILVVSLLLIGYVKSSTEDEFAYINSNRQKNDKFNEFAVIVSVTVPIVFMIIAASVSMPMFGNSDNYRNVIGQVKETDFKDSTLSVSLNHIRTVDEDVAKALGDKKLGEYLGLGSRVTIGKYSIQKVNDKLYWIAPLEFKSFFKWLNDDDGTEGYIMVSAQDSSDVKLITEVEGKKISLNYLHSAYFGNNIERHLYFNGFMSIGLTDYTFEVDENLRPFYVVSLYEKTVGFEGENVIGVATIDVQTGSIKRYNLDNVPEWIDRIQPESFIKTQLNDWGLYIHGWWNSIGFSEQKEVIKLTDGQKLVYGSDGNSYWYSGVTSIGRDSSIIGFLLTDTRTKKTLFYRQSGATEKSSMNSAEGAVQEKNYKASFPSLYKLAGIPTYVLTLKDNEGLVKLFAMVSVEKYEIVGVGTTLKSALRDYKSMLNSKGNNLTISSDSKLIEIKGEIERFSIDVRNGNSFYMIKILNKKMLFVGNSNLSDELPMSVIGDFVILKYNKGDNDDFNTHDLKSFKNSSLFQDTIIQ